MLLAGTFFVTDFKLFLSYHASCKQSNTEARARGSVNMHFGLACERTPAEEEAWGYKIRYLACELG